MNRDDVLELVESVEDKEAALAVMYELESKFGIDQDDWDSFVTSEYFSEEGDGGRDE